MAEVVTMFRNKMNGYNKEEVNLYVKDREEKLQEKDATITSLNEQVAELQKQLAEAQEAAKLASEAPAPVPAVDSDPILDAEIAEKAEKFDLLMKRWGDEEMGPAIAKKKVILEEAERAADVFYEKSAEKVAACLDADLQSWQKHCAPTWTHISTASRWRDASRPARIIPSAFPQKLRQD